MRLFLALLTALAVSWAALPAAAQTVVTSERPDTVAVTIYRAPDRDADEAIDRDWLQGYALITEERVVNVPAGRAVIRFEGVASGMLPESALVTGLPSGVTEKNLDADLLSPRSLFDRAYGRPVTLRRTNRANGQVSEERAIIRSSPDGAAILQTAKGFEAVTCGPLDDALVYDSLPAGLSARPTLSVETNAPQGGQVRLKLSYLAWGFDWQANYVVTLDQTRAGRAELFAWVTLASQDVTSFEGATTAVVAGEVNREDEAGYPSEPDGELDFECFAKPPPPPPPPPPAPPPPAMMAAPMAMVAEDIGSIVVTGARAKAVAVAQEELGDLKLYRMPFPTTVAANAQKQVGMLNKPGVPVKVVHTTDIFSGNPDDVTIELRAMNKASEGLGVPLPAGPVALFEPQDGEPLLIGESALADKAVGEEVEIAVGDSTQVTAEGEEIGDGDDWSEYRVTVSNANPWPVLFEGRIILDDGERIARASARLGRKEGQPIWTPTVPANGRAVLTYRVRGPKD
ncbi:hypothetical protein NYR55_07375 [Sphingomonas sp. BGYR3]|uniref:DUF4139 domain-containing protein n=1 Tax=Sphingomonas sp. BGYR3 TaxID=2975483 RepID=UPI0021A38E89|nr:hypothetical protein [Sphingomonas sp. BGYR3]MDG5488434.1 hypothetical protein [Sphingomonas sp. BGYR3]